ncbi:MAG TPA: hypothetical protein VD837_06520, partial [Terriglobales bacterium]|nr:hypothetical protein [Terriglobales bacterium]
MNSNYHGLQTTVKKSFSNGLQFNANYTWSKVLDFMSDAFQNRGGARPTDNMNKAVDYGPADFDIRHRFVTSFSYDLPFLKSNRWIGGWSVNGILSLQTGVPFSPYHSNFDANRDGYLTDRVRYVGSGSPNSSTSIQKDIEGSSNVGFFSAGDWATANCAGINGGAWCNGGLGRNNLHGPGYFNTDLGVSKKFKVNERAAFIFQGNFFNLFNHTNFNLPVSNMNDSAFGEIRSIVGNARITQLALRFEF